MHQTEISKVVSSLNSDLNSGLSAEQVEASRLKYGSNELEQKKKKLFIVKFFEQFANVLIIILLISALISFLIDPHEWIDSVVILFVVILNAILGVVQEDKAEKSLEALMKMSAPNAKVIRNNEVEVVSSKDIVVGDIVLLEAGDLIPSDGRLIETNSLMVDESALTGESVPVTKDLKLITKENVTVGDKKNMVFSSTVVTYGRGKYIVTSIGMQTEVGKIANLLLEDKKQTTPLQQQLQEISKFLGFAALIVCGVVFVLELISGLSVIDAFKTSISLAVAAIPEGLPTVVTVVLSIGVVKMVKKNAIIRKLPAVETLGCASIICSDKTGTLTQNKMTVLNYALNNQENCEIGVLKTKEEKEMFELFSICTDCKIILENGQEKIIGDPSETCLVSATNLYGTHKTELDKKYKRINEIAFDSERKMMSVLVKSDEGLFLVTKGAIDVILERSSNIKNKKQILQINENQAKNALRVLAVAYKKLDRIPEEVTSEALENNLTYVGMVAMIDPPRVEAKNAISDAKKAGIRTVMITGDHILTASAIAKQLGILDDTTKAITGAELSEMSDEDLAKNIAQYSVYARVAPLHKVRIVNAWKENGQIVAMTGDGVNDAPALKASDIGCAMGITGTEVAKSAAVMILVDDNFATIVSSVKEGRGIYSNIKKVVQFLLSSNIGEIVTIFVASIIGLIVGQSVGVPLLPIHLLFVNLITDSLPAFALGMEKTEEDVMDELPRKKNDKFFKDGMIFTIAWQGILVGLLTLAAYFIGGKEYGVTMAFTTLSMTQLFHAFNIKNHKSVFSKATFDNLYLWLAFILGLAFILAVVYLPFLNVIFSLKPLTINYLLISLGLSISIILFVEISKLFKRK